LNRPGRARDQDWTVAKEFLMNEIESRNAGTARKPSERRGHGAAILVLAALAMIAVAWFWTMRTPQKAGLGAEHVVLVIGAGALVSAAIAYVREMDFIDVLEMLGALCMGLVSLVGAILKGIWDTILGFFGWD
jgi:hypothetical protein